MEQRILDRQNQAMKEGYHAIWNPEEQRRIDQDIERNRKADGVFTLPQIPTGADVHVEQISHDFIFGAHIFNFDQLGSDECNAKYRNLYGTLFNSATIALYWKELELLEGHPRFEAEYRDSAEFWNRCEAPKYQPHWRRPAPDPVVKFCKSRGIRLHGHTLVWGSNCWQLPDWLLAEYPKEMLSECDIKTSPKNGRVPGEGYRNLFGKYTPEEFAQKYPDLVKRINLLTAKRIYEIALRYGDVIDSWDVVNESAMDFAEGRLLPGSAICSSVYGPMPGDYPYRAFKLAESILPAKAKFNINDWAMSQSYADEVIDLKQRGCKVDIVGEQMHLFNPQTCLDIADGVNSPRQTTPEAIRCFYAMLEKTGTPVHLSEITITSPQTGDGRGEDIQAVIMRNLYRLWFSLAPTMGITWWNVVDDCGAPGEPSYSGLFHRNMTPKQSYYAMEDLICHQWHTELDVKAGKDGEIAFRGFRGRYRLTWDGGETELHLK